MAWFSNNAAIPCNANWPNWMVDDGTGCIFVCWLQLEEHLYQPRNGANVQRALSKYHSKRICHLHHRHHIGSQELQSNLITLLIPVDVSKDVNEVLWKNYVYCLQLHTHTHTRKLSIAVPPMIIRCKLYGCGTGFSFSSLLHTVNNCL